MEVIDARSLSSIFLSQIRASRQVLVTASKTDSSACLLVEPIDARPIHANGACPKFCSPSPPPPPYSPLNFLGNNPHRYIAMLVFAIMSGDILKFFFHHSHFVIKVTPEASNCYVKVLYEMSSLLLLISYLSIKYFPLLACLGVVIPVLDPAIGLLYSITLYVNALPGRTVLHVHARFLHTSCTILTCTKFGHFLAQTSCIYLARFYMCKIHLARCARSLQDSCKKVAKFRARLSSLALQDSCTNVQESCIARFVHERARVLHCKIRARTCKNLACTCKTVLPGPILDCFFLNVLTTLSLIS